MEVIFTEDGRVKIRTKDKIQNAIDTLEALWEEITTNVSSKESRHLFEVNSEAEILEGKENEIFHSVNQKLLFIGKISRPNIETAASVLCKRVTKSDKDDWKKLRRVMAYLKINNRRLQNIGDKPRG